MSIAQLPDRASHAHRSHVVALVSQIPSDRLSVTEELLADIIAHQEADARSLTTSGFSALERLGVTGDELVGPTSLAATARGRLREHEFEQQSYSVIEAASMLGVTAARVRQRCTNGTLLAQR